MITKPSQLVDNGYVPPPPPVNVLSGTSERGQVPPTPPVTPPKTGQENGGSGGVKK